MLTKPISIPSIETPSTGHGKLSDSMARDASSCGAARSPLHVCSVQLVSREDSRRNIRGKERAEKCVLFEEQARKVDSRCKYSNTAAFETHYNTALAFRT